MPVFSPNGARVETRRDGHNVITGIGPGKRRLIGFAAVTKTPADTAGMAEAWIVKTANENPIFEVAEELRHLFPAEMQAQAEAALPETDDEKVERARRTVQAFDLLAELDRHWGDPIPFFRAGRVYDDATMSLWARCRELLTASGRAPA